MRHTAVKKPNFSDLGNATAGSSAGIIAPEMFMLIFSAPYRLLELHTNYSIASAATWWAYLAHPGITAKGISRLVNIEQRKVQKEIREQIHEGWVVQEIDQVDSRLRRLYPTQASVDTARKIIKDLLTHEDRLTAEIGSL